MDVSQSRHSSSSTLTSLAFIVNFLDVNYRKNLNIGKRTLTHIHEPV